MPNTRLVIPNMYGGVSRQPDSVRHDNQVEEAENVYLTVRNGATKRPGTKWIGTMATGTTACRLHQIDRDGTEQYLIAHKDGGVVYASDVAGTAATVTMTAGAQAYLEQNAPAAGQLRMVTLSDYTIIANTTVATGWLDADTFLVTSEFDNYDIMVSNTPAEDTYHRTREDTVTQTAGYWKYEPGAGTFSRLKCRTCTNTYATPSNYASASRNPGGFKISWHKNDGSTETIEAAVDMQRATLNDMHDVAAEFQRALRNAGASSACVSWEYTATDAGFFTITTPYRGSTATWPTTPLLAPTTGFNYTVNDGPFDDDLGDSTKYNGTGSAESTPSTPESRWQRVPAPGQKKAKLNPAKMPVKMVLTSGSPSTFAISEIDWKFRETGDEYSNPLPEIVDKERKISDVAFHRNRLVLTGEDIVMMSQSGDVFNFFATDADLAGDADPIEAPVNTNQITLVDSVVPFQRSLAIFTKAAQQFELNSPDTLTQNSASITATTAYRSLIGVRPVAIGNRLYFAAQLQDYTQLYEYFYEESAASSDAADVSAHALGYIPSGIKRLVSVPNTGSVIVLPSSGTTLYLYASFWSGDKKVQSAWSKLTFPAITSIEDIAVIGNDCYMLARTATTGSKVGIVKLPMSEEAISNSSTFKERLDMSQTVTGTYSSGTGLTTWSYKEGSRPTTIVTRYGVELTVYALVGETTRTISAVGNYGGEPAFIGRPFDAAITLSRPFQRDQTGIAMLDTEVTLDKLVTQHQKSGAYSVEITQPGRPTRTITFTPRSGTIDTLGEFQCLVMGNAKTTTIKLKGTSVRPMSISSIEYIGTATQRGQ